MSGADPVTQLFMAIGGVLVTYYISSVANPAASGRHNEEGVIGGTR